MGRMDKYQNDTASSRLNRNKKLYDEVSDINIDYIDINYDNSVVINPKKISKNKREDYHAIRDLDGYVSVSRNKEECIEKPKEEKIYDIDEILKRARQNNLFEDDKKKRLINTEYNILSKLDLDTIEKEDLSKEDLHSLIDTIYDNEDKKRSSSRLKKNKRADYETDLMGELIDDNSKSELVMNTDIAKKILDNDSTQKNRIVEVDNSCDESKKNDTTTVTYKIENNKETKKNVSVDDDRSMTETEITDRVLRSLDDTDTIDGLERKSKFLLVIIIIVVLALFAVGGYLFYRYFHL